MMPPPARNSDETLFRRILRWARDTPSFPLAWEWPISPDETGPARNRAPRIFSYRDAVVHASRMSSEIGMWALPSGSLVGVVLSPGYSYIVSLMALEAAGLLPILIDHALPPSEIRSVLDSFSVEGLLLEEDVWCADDRERLPRDIKTRALARWHESVEDLSDEEWKRLSDELESRVPFDPSRIACLLLTSGTTGPPKGVPLTHGNLFANVRMLEKSRIYERGDRVLGVLPLHHSYPLMSLVYLPAAFGCTTAFVPDLLPETIGHAMSTFNPTLFPGVPSLWEGFHRRICDGIAKRGSLAARVTRKLLMPFVLFMRLRFGWNPGKVLFASLHRRFGNAMKIMASGGAALGSGVCRDYWAWGITLLEGYGLTETSPVLTFNNPSRFRIGSVGPPLEGVSLSILSPSPGNEFGEVIAKGENIASEYWMDRKRRSPIADEDGWFHTGDLGVQEEGFLFLKGREKELLVLPNGKKIQPDSIELLLRDDPLVSEAVLTLRNGVPWLLFRPDEEAFRNRQLVQMKPELSSSVDRLNRKLPPHVRIGGYSITRDPLPRTRLGKVRRFELPSIVERIERRDRSNEAIREEGEEEPVRRALEILRDVLGTKGPLSEEDHLEVDLGMDSLSRIDLASRLEEAFGETVSEDRWDAVRTVGDLIAMVRSLETGGTVAAQSRFLDAPLSPEEAACIPVRPGTGGPPLIWFRALKAVLKAIFGFYFRIRWPKFEKTPDGGWRYVADDGRVFDWPDGPTIIVANHESYLDGILVSLALPAEILMRAYFWGYSPLFEKGLLKRIRNLGGVVSIDPEEAATGLRVAYHLLEDGNTLAIFPEGGRTPDGSMKPFRPGTAYLLSVRPVPVIPVGILESFKAYSRYHRFPQPRRVGLRIGAPIPPGALRGLDGDRLGKTLEDSVRSLLNG